MLNNISVKIDNVSILDNEGRSYGAGIFAGTHSKFQEIKNLKIKGNKSKECAAFYITSTQHHSTNIFKNIYITGNYSTSEDKNTGIICANLYTKNKMFKMTQAIISGNKCDTN